MKTEKLFSYGTLCYESVQLATFGRKLQGTSDVLQGYRLSQITITDPDVIAKSGESVHNILIHTNNKADEVSGIVFDITAKELQHADEYEVADYKRIRVMLRSGISAWVYVDAKN
jgi:gamma-glutamylcyclotransferase (GGCT)/AIG2-like uncharacterized protein YtfP